MKRAIFLFLALTLAACGGDKSEPLTCGDAVLKAGDPHQLTISTSGADDADSWQVYVKAVDETWAAQRGDGGVTVDVPDCTYIPTKLEAYRGDELIGSCALTVRIVTETGAPGVCLINNILPAPSM